MEMRRVVPDIISLRNFPVSVPRDTLVDRHVLHTFDVPPPLVGVLRAVLPGAGAAGIRILRAAGFLHAPGSEAVPHRGKAQQFVLEVRVNGSRLLPQILHGERTAVCFAASSF